MMISKNKKILSIALTVSIFLSPLATAQSEEGHSKTPGAEIVKKEKNNNPINKGEKKGKGKRPIYNKKDTKNEENHQKKDEKISNNIEETRDIFDKLTMKEYMETVINPPVNPLPNIFLVGAFGFPEDINGEVSPPINPLPRRKVPIPKKTNER